MNLYCILKIIYLFTFNFKCLVNYLIFNFCRKQLFLRILFILILKLTNLFTFTFMCLVNYLIDSYCIKQLMVIIYFYHTLEMIYLFTLNFTSLVSYLSILLRDMFMLIVEMTVLKIIFG